MSTPIDSDAHSARDSPVHLKPNAKAAENTSMEEAVNMNPNDIKGPSVITRALDEVSAVGETAKEAVVGSVATQGQVERANAPNQTVSSK